MRTRPGRSRERVGLRPELGAKKRKAGSSGKPLACVGGHGHQSRAPRPQPLTEWDMGAGPRPHRLPRKDSPRGHAADSAARPRSSRNGGFSPGRLGGAQRQDAFSTMDDAGSPQEHVHPRGRDERRIAGIAGRRCRKIWSATGPRVLAARATAPMTRSRSIADPREVCGDASVRGTPIANGPSFIRASSFSMGLSLEGE